ncbi:serine/threonine-protein kinase Nek4 isoform X2 [Colius striatus]|uniref:serine/threonine-protein kinase Nek4 isoform X2 n=1 Tax=Colius striatus TaxID=57412 RepID=UPI002B1D6F02|nr:serine/threonine-protein kinase Nek4 isoform X2 [Colius striatus]
MSLSAYCILRVVGKGSYGEVNLVRHQQDNQQYVIKKLNLRYASSRVRKAAEQEAQLLSQLKHPNIVAYRESWQGEDGLLYIVMGFCEGGDLYQKLQERKGELLPEKQVVEWFIQIAMALQSDVWALGCCVYEMATLKHAFNAKDMNSLAYQIVKGKLPPMPKDYSPQLVEIVRTMLSKKPEERPSMKTILRHPYIKHQISSFLEALKAKEAKSHKRKVNSKSNHAPERARTHKVNLDSTEKLLAPFVPVAVQDEVCPGASVGAQEKVTSHLQPLSSVSEPSLSQHQQKKTELAEVSSEKMQLSTVAPQPLSLPSDVDTTTTLRCAEQHNAEASESVHSTKTSPVDISKGQPLSARERRRLKQAREKMLSAVVPARRTSDSEVVGANSHMENHIEVAQSSSAPSISQRETHCLSDNDLSSSTSSTEKSDSDSKERKSNVNEMSDLVQLMTRTLKMDSEDNSEYCVTSTQAPEFKLHRKYRDTLILHGKSADESEDLKFEEISSDTLSFPDKIRRMVEILRSDVVQGLGVKLLEKVYSIMEEDDELKREAQLREHMGDKYGSYSAKARHLKFLEENVKF